MGAKQRQLLNLAIFEKLYVIEDYVSDASYNAPFDELESLRRAWESKAESKGRISSGSSVGVLADAFFGRRFE
jgi:hypothetical protein